MTPRSAAEREPGTVERVCPTCGHRPHNPGSCKARYIVTGKPPEAGDPCLCENWRAVEATAAVPLDVERLALALHEERSDWWGGCGNPGEAYDDHMTFHQTRAERIVAEYARLSADEEGGTT